jgi:hypothetical protein
LVATVKDKDFNPDPGGPLVTTVPPTAPTAAYGQSTTNGWGLNKPFKGLRFFEDDVGRAIAIPVIITNPASNIPTNTITPNIDGEIPNSSLEVAAFNFYYNGTTWDRAHVSTGVAYVHSGVVISGTPVQVLAAGGAGLKYRLLKCTLGVSLCGTANSNIYVSDGTTNFAGVTCATTTGQGPYVSFDFGNGVVTAANAAVSLYNSVATDATADVMLAYSGPLASP